MSLQQAAQHLAAQGRGKDTTLVHMTPNEVRGLQQIAMAAGGSLSINPSTGLPEAGFLEDMLPMIIGAGLIAATGGAAAPGVLAGLTPGMIGLGVGGVQALRTGNLMEGVKAGLGAYGGAGLATGLIGAGASDLAGVNIANEATMATGPGSAAYEGISIPDGYKQLAAQTATPERIAAARAASTPVDLLSRGASSVIDSPSSALNFAKANAKSIGAAAAPAIASAMEPGAPPPAATSDKDMGQRYAYDQGTVTPFPQPNVPRAGSPEQFQSFGKEQRYFTPGYNKITADEAKSIYGFAEGGDTTFKYDPGKQQYEAIKQAQSRSPTTKELVNAGNIDSGGGGGDGSSNSSSGYGDFGMGAISAGQALSSYGNAFGGLAPGGMLAGLIGAGLLAHGIDQLGQAENDAATMGGVAGTSGSYGGSAAGDAAIGGADNSGGPGGVDAGGVGGDAGYQQGGLMHAYAAGGRYNLGDYSDGGRLLRGPGDGVSDSIPAMIGKKQPARLADGEFVVPARIVSELGNGSTEAGARKLYAMMDRVQSARGKTVSKGKVAKNSRAERYLPV